MSIFPFRRGSAVTPEEKEALQRIEEYRESYRKRLEEAAAAEAERRSADGEVCIAGCWVPESQAARVRNGLNLRWAIALLEVWAAVALTIAVAYGLWWLFEFLFLP